MTEENQEIMEVVENNEIEVVEKKKIHKGAIIAGLAAAGVGIACGVKWLIGKLRYSSINYVDIEEDDHEFKVYCDGVDISNDTE